MPAGKHTHLLAQALQLAPKTSQTWSQLIQSLPPALAREADAQHAQRGSSTLRVIRVRLECVSSKSIHTSMPRLAGFLPLHESFLALRDAQIFKAIKLCLNRIALTNSL